MGREHNQRSSGSCEPTTTTSRERVAIYKESREVSIYVYIVVKLDLAPLIVFYDATKFDTAF